MDNTKDLKGPVISHFEMDSEKNIAYIIPCEADYKKIIGNLKSDNDDTYIYYKCANDNPGPC